MAVKHVLEGRQIARVRRLTVEELRREGWPETAWVAALELDNGMLLFASRDEEGNGPGELFGYDGEAGILITAN